jgi:hypothetical protein
VKVSRKSQFRDEKKITIKNTSIKSCLKKKGINEMFLGRSAYLTGVCDWQDANAIRP